LQHPWWGKKVQHTVQGEKRIKYNLPYQGDPPPHPLAREGKYYREKKEREEREGRGVYLGGNPGHC
jgi:hypothetical protein